METDPLLLTWTATRKALEAPVPRRSQPQSKARGRGLSGACNGSGAKPMHGGHSNQARPATQPAPVPALTWLGSCAVLCAQDSVETPSRHSTPEARGAAALVERIPLDRLGLHWAGGLPEGVLVHALRLLPTDCRVRASAVCRAWRDAAADPSLQQDIWFSTTEDTTGPLRRQPMNIHFLRRLCARAGAALRTMDLSSTCSTYACVHIDADEVVEALHAGGCTGLQRLTFPDYSHDLSNIHQACLTQHDRELLNIACPALQFCDCAVNCQSAADVAPALAMAAGPRWLVMSDPNPEGTMRAAFGPNPQVTGLVLRWCLQEAQVLREALQSNTTLETLVLDGCDLAPAPVAALG